MITSNSNESSQSALSRIRKEISNRKNLSAKPCPLCGHQLSIEQTPFFTTELCEGCYKYAVIDETACCASPLLQKVKYAISGGGIQVRNQCASCGDMSNNSIGGLTADEKSKLPLADLTKRDQRNTNKYDFYSRSNKAKAEAGQRAWSDEKAEWFRKYNNYLNSTIWLHKRLAILKRDDYLCQCCLTNVATQVHHKSYQFVDFKGSEPAFDLESICRPCHDNIEDMKSQNKQNAAN
jgi:5-methylcytosine-specific restriction endonuclease McrA